MRSLTEARSCLSARLGVLAMIAVGVAGCSADASRFGDKSLTASVTAKPGEATAASPRGRVEAQGLPAPSAPANTSSTGVASSRPPSQVPTTRVAAAPARPVGARIGAANAPIAMHQVAPGETLTAIARRYGKTRAEVAKANKINAHGNVRVGQKLVIPGGRSAPTKTADNRAHRPAAAAPQAAPQAAPIQVAAKEPAATARMAAPVDAQPASPSATAELTGAVPSFRWPVRGRVIAGYGTKVNGTSNDGINLAVPEGTSVKAAEDGIVAYAGNELKGYGNLVLVRHGNGFVTAYAHASEIMVKRGDQVKRGQIVARAGQTGNVTSPQLHFEIRKGSTPVDPSQYLNGN
jgi:murein DD-endopeptidase MepM/ murein hydrolase activator NlpD